MASSSNVARRSQVERRIFQVIGPREMPAKALAARAGISLGQRLYKALNLLSEAGVVVRGRRGWRLAEV
jgi:hypothetical protein